MAKLLSRRRFSSLLPNHLRLPHVLVLGSAVLGCDGGPERITGPTTPAEPSPTDVVRLSRLTTTFHDGRSSLNRYRYDDAGRLARVELEINFAPGAPLQLTRYATHEWTGTRLTASDSHARMSNGQFRHVAHWQYVYDALGYLVRIEREFLLENGQVGQDTVRFRYDRHGRQAEVRANGELTIYRYGDDGSLREEEKRFPDGTVFHVRYEHDRGRNPFYRRVDLVVGTVLAWQSPPLLLSPANAVREEQRVGKDPDVVSYVTNEYAYDSGGRPRQNRQSLVNAAHPSTETMVFVMDYEYEPAT